MSRFAGKGVLIPGGTSRIGLATGPQRILDKGGRVLVDGQGS